MSATIKLEIVTPEGKAFSDDVDMVTLTGIDGEMGILPQHMPLMTQLMAGEITAIKKAEVEGCRRGDKCNVYPRVVEPRLRVHRT